MSAGEKELVDGDYKITSFYTSFFSLAFGFLGQRANSYANVWAM